MPHCTLLAERNYVAMMIDRPGSKYDEWLTEVEEGIELLKSIPFTDDDRVDAMGSSFGFQSISYYALRHPNEIQGYINDSGITTRGSCDSLANVDTPALVLSGGGEYQENVKDCDRDGFSWTTAFTENLGRKTPTRSGNAWPMMKQRGVHPPWILVVSRSSRNKNAIHQILDFLEATVGRRVINHCWH